MDSRFTHPLLSSFADSLDESLASDADLERGELRPHKPASHPVQRVSALRIFCIGLALMVSASLYFAVQFATINVRPCGSTSVNASLPEVRLKRMVLPWFFNWKTAQGVASDAKYLYFSGRNSIRKVKLDRFATTVRNNPSAIPQVGPVCCPVQPVHARETDPVAHDRSSSPTTTITSATSACTTARSSRPWKTRHG